MAEREAAFAMPKDYRTARYGRCGLALIMAVASCALDDRVLTRAHEPWTDGGDGDAPPGITPIGDASTGDANTEIDGGGPARDGSLARGGAGGSGASDGAVGDGAQSNGGASSGGGADGGTVARGGGAGSAVAAGGGGGRSGDGGSYGSGGTSVAGGTGGTQVSPDAAAGGVGGAGGTTTAVDPRTVQPGTPDQGLPFGCGPATTAWTPTTYCHIQNNGYDKGGNPQADVGDTAAWIYWSRDAVSGWICMNDDQANGRGLGYRVLVHKAGAPLTMPSDAFISATDAFVEIHNGDATSNGCSWIKLSGTVAEGIDSVVVEWEDRWTSSAGAQTSHYDGRQVVPSPLF